MKGLGQADTDPMSGAQAHVVGAKVSVTLSPALRVARRILRSSNSRPLVSDLSSCVCLTEPLYYFPCSLAGLNPSWRQHRH
jgi:hypothetical protein